jgi:ketosteroid isomerase-like protein
VLSGQPAGIGARAADGQNDKHHGTLNEVDAGLLRALQRAYAAFNRGDIELPLSMMCEDVDWANTIEGGREQGREAVRAYWTRVLDLLVPRVDPLGIEQGEGGTTVVYGQQRFNDSATGRLLAHQHFQHVYTWRGGLVARMDAVEPRLAELSARNRAQAARAM